MTDGYIGDEEIKELVPPSQVDDLTSFLDHYNLQLSDRKEYSDSDPTVSVIAPHSEAEYAHHNFLNQMKKEYSDSDPTVSPIKASSQKEEEHINFLNQKKLYLQMEL